MKSSTRKWFMPCICIAALTSQGNSDPAPQKLEFTEGLQGTFNADWEGVAARTYFMQFSTNLVDWHFAPFIDYGEGAHRRGIDTDAVRFFLRLRYGDFPGINSLDDAMNADFDGDGLSNIFEITHGYDPFDDESTSDGPDASHDPDGDGIGNSTEQAEGTNPIAMDNPIAQLEVTVD